MDEGIEAGMVGFEYIGSRAELVINIQNTGDEKSIRTLPVYAAAGFCVTDGVNYKDPIGHADELVLDDVYALAENSSQVPLVINRGNTEYFVIADGSPTGKHGNRLFPDCTVTLIGNDLTPFDVVVLVEVDQASGLIADVYLMPLAPLLAKTDYRLVKIDRGNAIARMAEAACASFARGTCITMASGQQRPIENLNIGDRVLTRDNGVQNIRWIGQTTMRAVGDFAPVVITKGTLYNENDLVVSPNHRLFIYQRVDRLGTGRSEVLVKAMHLVNGRNIVRQTGGFVDYYQLLFDDHQIIFAEGIAAESLILDDRTTPALPKDVAQKIGHMLHQHGKRTHEDLELDPDDISGVNIAERLRRASNT